MKKVFKLSSEETFNQEEARCPSCGYHSSIIFVLDRSKELAVHTARHGDYFCGNCLADHISENQIPVKSDNQFYTSDYPDICFVDWFKKEDVESWLEQDITDNQWEWIKEWIELTEIPESFNEWLIETIEIALEQFGGVEK